MTTPQLDVDFPDLRDQDDYSKVLKLARDNVYSMERKYDGTACIVDIFGDGRTPILWGRGVLKDGSQQDYTANFPEITEFFDSIDLPRTRLLGELVVFNGEEIEKFKWIQPRLIRKYGIEELAKEFPATFMVYDILIYDGLSLINDSYAVRRKLLQEVVGDLVRDREGRFRIIPSFTTSENKEDLLLDLQDRRFEGVVIKDRTKSMVGYKYKPTITEDVIWFGEYNEGTGKNAGQVGSMVCYQYINGELVEIANVGGLTVSARGHFTHMAKGGKVSRDNPIVLEVEAMSRGERTKKGKIGKLRHPRYSRIRLDKSPEQCTREE